MPNNPLQYVVNGDMFIQDKEPGRKGPEKDFFENRDADFAAHQQSLIAALATIDSEIKSGGYGPATYVRVALREEALAKSYRPNSALLTADRFPCVGAGAIGEIFFFLPLVQLPELAARVRAAEATVVTRTTKAGVVYRACTRLRSEVGAIETIEILPAADKRRFKAQDAVAAFLEPHTFPGYQIELFEVPPQAEIATDRVGRRELFESFFHVLLSLGPGSRSILLPDVGRTPMLELQLTRSTDAPQLVDLRQPVATSAGTVTTQPVVDVSVPRHDAALNALARHPLVRRIDPPLSLSLDQKGKPAQAKPFAMPAATPGTTYPRLGIIDSGVSSALASWTLGRFDYLKPHQVDEVHGTGVATLAVAGQSANGPAIAPEPDGCQIYDLPLFPNLPFGHVYPGGFAAFLEEVEQGVREAKDEHGVRIFNMSINTFNAVERHNYSALAARLDAIADRHQVLIVNSAGNLKGADVRAPWPKTPRDVLAYFAARTAPDTICQPTESVRGLSVGALDPPGTAQVTGAPARYTRRGPGLEVGIKPDLVHYGGSAPFAIDQTTGLVSAKPDGSPILVCGTSFAAPLVARTLADLDQKTSQGLAPRTLRALAVHHAETPAPLAKRGLKVLARQFSGFGKPPGAADMLETSDSTITLVFEGILPKGVDRPQIMRFAFVWPAALVDPVSQGCTGRARLTLAYDAPLDPAFGAEFTRVNLDAALKQQQPKPRKDGSPSFADQTTMFGLPKSSGLPERERALIDHGLKWWPTKRYGANFEAHGSSANWRLEINSLTRAEAEFPAEGVPFALILTIEDPDGQKPIYQSFRQYLQARAIQVEDIRTVQRIRARAP